MMMSEAVSEGYELLVAFTDMVISCSLHGMESACQSFTTMHPVAHQKLQYHEPL